MNCRLKSKGWWRANFCALAHGNRRHPHVARDAPVTLPLPAKVSLRGMKLAELQVLHLDGSAVKLAPAALARLRASRQAWVIDTCQRTVIVAPGRHAHPPEPLAELLPTA